MRYVVVKERQQCAFCKQFIPEGDIAIQSEGFARLFYHCEYSKSSEQDCHWERATDSGSHNPFIGWDSVKMTKTVEKALEKR